MNRNQRRGPKNQPYSNPNKTKAGGQKGQFLSNTVLNSLFNRKTTQTPSPPLPPSPTTQTPSIFQSKPEEKASIFSFSNTKTPDFPMPTPPITPQPTSTTELQPKSTKGLCDKMCPDSYAENIIKNYNRIFDVGPDGNPDRELFITNNPRCTSDRKNDPKDVRSEIGLKKAYDRIHDVIIPFCEDVEYGPLYQIYYYLKEILASLVKDAKLTARYSQLFIDILEFSIRFCIQICYFIVLLF